MLSPAVAANFAFGFSLEQTLVIVAGAVVFLISFIDTDLALNILIFSMLLSPEFNVGSVGGGREIALRFDDVFIFIIFFTWIARMAINKELGFLRVTPLNRIIILYIFVYILTTLLGVMRGYVHLARAFFYLLKYFEYFLLFFMVTNSLKTKKQAKFFVYSILFVGLVISLYAWGMHLGGAERVAAPFEGREAESNTLGGYLMFIIMIALGLIMNVPSAKERIFFAVVLVLAFPSLLFTLSRGSWLGFSVAILGVIFFSRRGRFAIILGTVALTVLVAAAFPKTVQERIIKVKERIAYTFTKEAKEKVMGRQMNMDSSSAARLENWDRNLKALVKEPVFGFGAGSAFVVDNSYVRILVETGVVGFLAFMLIIVAIFQMSFVALFKLKEDRFSLGLIVGFISGLVGFLFHAMTAETFVIIRIMEPFWFIAAIVAVLPEIVEDEKKREEMAVAEHT